jgi:membrane fusion protein, copper/silver efflux system
MEIQLPGKIAVDERRTSFVTAQFPGRIENLYVNFTGESISRGQRVARIYSPELIAAQRELIEAIRYRETNPEIYNAVRNRLKLWGLSESQVNAIEQRKEVSSTVDIHSTKSGVVTGKMVSPGDYVETGMTLFELADLSNLWVLFGAYERDISFIKRGDKISFSATGAPGQTFEATVTFIDPVIDPMTRTANIRAETSNRNNLLKPEMLVTGVLNTSPASQDQQIVIPKTAVLWTGKRSVVYLSLSDYDVPTYRMQEIVLGPSLGNFYVVEEGLQPGDEIVTNGVFTIDAQAQLTNRRSMMNKSVEIAGTSDRPTIKVIPDYSAQAPSAFKNQLQNVVNAYLKVKDALVNDNAATAKSEAGNAVDVVKKVDMSLVKGEAHEFWMEQQEALLHHFQQINKTNKIEEQRNEFNFLSTAMISTIEGFGNTGPLLYLQYCPMANNDEGAYWLSREEIIANPYFGASMLRCGEVRGRYPKPAEESPAARQPTPGQPPVHRH